MSEVKILHPHPALLLRHQRSKYLVVTDLHIGFEEKMISAGIKVATSVQAMLSELTSLLDKHRPDNLVILGDVKYSVVRTTLSEMRLIPEFLNRIADKVEISIVPGNHDGTLTPLLPQSVRLGNVSGSKIGMNFLTHGHTIPGEKYSPIRRVIMGHIHPTYRRRGSPLAGKQVWLMLKTPAALIFPNLALHGSVEVIVMPTFNRELNIIGYSGFPGKITSPLLRRIKSGVDEALVITLEGEIIGDVDSLQYVL